MSEVEIQKERRDFVAHTNQADNEVYVEKKSEFRQLYTRENLQLEFSISPEVLQSTVDKSIYEAAARILCGEKETSAEYFDLAKRIVRTFGPEAQTKNSRETVEIKAKFEPYRDNDLSSRLTQLAQSREVGGILAKQRQMLGTQNTEAEKPFNVAVLHFPGWDTMKAEERQVAWVKETGAATMFAVQDKNVPESVPTIYLSSDDARQLLDNNGHSKGVTNVFEHEYRHTQRSWSSHDGALMGVPDEAYTNVASAYADLRTMMRVLCGTTTELDANDFVKAYEKGDEDLKQDLLKRFAQNFGEEGLLLLAAKPVRGTDSGLHGLGHLPLLENRNLEVNEEMRFLETMLDWRAKKDKQWLENFIAYLKSNPSVSRKWLEVIQDTALTTYLNGIDESGAVHVRALRDAMLAEIQRRKLNGEPGFYSK